MPTPESSDRKQKAVLWAATGFSDYGRHKVSDPVEIKVRWEERRREFTDANGNTIAVDASVVVDREVAVGSIMWLGKKADLATPPVNLKEVVGYGAIPDVKGRKIRRTVLLTRYSNELPALA
ncbi:MAG: hypothetical protein ACYTEW_21465 [Planctomycetota bacterium]|jgi:hypothetical protein